MRRKGEDCYIYVEDGVFPMMTTDDEMTFLFCG